MGFVVFVGSGSTFISLNTMKDFTLSGLFATDSNKSSVNNSSISKKIDNCTYILKIHDQILGYDSFLSSDSLLLFTLSLSKIVEGDKTRNINYFDDAAIEYLSYDIGNDISLIQENDTIECQLSHFISGKVGNTTNTVIAAFPKSAINLKNEILFQFQDNLYGNGAIRFQLKI